MPLTLQALIERVDEVLGGRRGVARLLGISRQRVAEFVRGGPPLRAAHLVRLAHLTGLDVCDVLRVGGQTRLADVLDVALRGRFAELTCAQRLLLRRYDALSEDRQRDIDRLLAALVVETPHERSGP